VLRIDPEPRVDLGPKTAGLVMDPHMLLAKHGLTSTEALGKAMDEEAEEPEQQQAQQEREAAAAREHRAVAWKMLTDHLSAMWSAMNCASMLRPSKYTIKHPQQRITVRQDIALEKLSFATAAIPREYRPAIRQLLELRKGLTKRQASDLLDILGASADYRRKHTPPGRPIYFTRWPAHLLGGLAPLSEDEFKPASKRAKVGA